MSTTKKHLTLAEAFTLIEQLKDEGLMPRMGKIRAIPPWPVRRHLKVAPKVSEEADDA